jgi:DNA-binding winged helix-turn-helix (wHTH) protein
MTLSTNALYEFGRFRLDPSEHLLLCDGKGIPLTPKSLEILLVLVQSNGRLMSKEDLMQKVWPDSFVEEANLTVNISALRRALGDASDGEQYIETVPKRGYRFVASVTEVREESQATQPLQPPKEENLAAPPGPPAPQSVRKFPSKVMALGLVLLGIALAVSYSAYRQHFIQKSLGNGPRRLAILPFRNLRQAAESDFLGLSLADAVITTDTQGAVTFLNPVAQSLTGWPGPASAWPRPAGSPGTPATCPGWTRGSGSTSSSRRSTPSGTS